jgi:hypothetical protein
MISGPVVLVGTHDAVIALQTDAQMVCRFTPFEVPRWQESDAFRRLLAAFERVLPLRLPSELAQRETGEISRIINAAAELAIRSGHEAIRIEHLKDVTSTSAG